MENYTGIVDYFIFGFIDNYSFYESELYEGSNIKVWKITVRSEVSPEDQQLICDTAQEIAGKAVGSDAEKVRIITKEIDDIISYEEIEGNNLATVIKTGKGCCRHYADLFYLACNYAGIDSRIVVGNCESEGDHAWNIVEVDDKWYHVDPTWEDDESGNWVLLGSNTIKETRSLYLNYEEFNEFYDISEEDYAA